jgi:hypothetical protein
MPIESGNEYSVEYVSSQRPEENKMPKQGDLELLKEPVAQRLLEAPIAARLAYNWRDGTPRVVPIWSYWNGSEIILCGPPDAPKMKVLRDGVKVALTIDETWPIRSLTVRGTLENRTYDGAIPEYPALVQKYVGILTPAWLEMYKAMFPATVRMAITPDWVGLIDAGSGEYMPGAIVHAMAGTA